ncbi:hypothetical protein [Actinocrispum sp. NPDC049592]|uniref:hypothetical protein n=1 Tax=Actinocrispum sp. NPDC049592 TaxID=3154835 RepID=UPI0034419B88
MFTLWLRSVGDLEPVGIMLTKRIPELTVRARSMILWHMKLGGHILDPEGRHIRGVPMRPWPEQNAIAAERALLDGCAGNRW